MNAQHLSDEAVAAFADGVLRGLARDRASRHIADCPECARAVQVQREAVLALRAAPAPALPSGLLDRLREVPATTAISVVPSSFTSDGSALFSAFGTMTRAALVPSGASYTPTASAAAVAAPQPGGRGRHSGPIALTAAVLAAAGVLAAASSWGGSAATGRSIPAQQPGQSRVVPASYLGGVELDRDASTGELPGGAAVMTFGHPIIQR